MDTVKLQHFVAICSNDCNLSKASGELYVSQPALSQSIASLESELAIKLFDRVKGRLHLTEKGKIVLEYAKEILSKEKELRHKIQEQNPTLSIFSIEPNLTYVIAAGFLQRNPKLRFIHDYDTVSDDYESIIYNSDYDLFITNKPIKGPEYNSLFLLNDCEYVYVPSDSEFYGIGSAFLEDFAENTFIRAINNMAFGFPYRISTYLSNLIEKNADKYNIYYFDSGVTNQIFMGLLDDNSDINKYYRCLPTLSFYSMYRNGAYLDERKRLVKLKNPEMTIPYYLVYKKTHSDVTEEFIEWIKENYNNIFSLPERYIHSL